MRVFLPFIPLITAIVCVAAYPACGAFDLAVEVANAGHLSVVVIPGFKTFRACTAAGNQAKQHYEGTITYICVHKTNQ